MTTIIYIGIWYLVCFVIIEAFLAFYNLTNRARFRYSSGDVTTEVGYEEDSVGRVLRANCGDEGLDSTIPHVDAPGSTNDSSF